MRRAWLLVVAVIALAVAPSTSDHSAAATTVNGFGVAAPATTVPTTEPATGSPATTTLDNEFLPADANIGDCVSALPRPECGSNARGGWRQTLVLIAVILALAVIGFRLVVAVRRRDRASGAAS